ncbi:unnamed protein product [Diabrotica balteata]|uniref:Chorion peroxidase n=1 Tax=Diabrotica balteata TaxID=107213 RepID=A0A9N9SQW6_DIABA|nr:unnamed protein product [Diabrotica balteata]
MWLFAIKVCLIVLTVILNTSEADECGPTLCDCSPETLTYRTTDGTCNNLNHITWGAAGRPYDRLTSGWFDADGISIPKSTCATNQDLPSARSVRLKVYTDDEIATDMNHTRNILSCLKFFIADIGNLKQFAAPAPCCSCNFQQLPDPPPYCSYIPIPANDPVYTEVGAKCMAVIKGISNLDLNCSYAYGSGPGYISTATFWMDMSQLYGSCDAENSAVRKFKLGELNLENRNGNYYYKNATSRTQCAIPPGTDEICYATADPNGNRLPDFTAFLTVAAREHNRMANILRNINTCWDDEKIYQEARHIHIAVYQHIMFYQVLPFVLGKQNMIDAGLIYPYSACSNDYDPNCSPDLAIEFSHGAMKGLHTMGRGRVV